MSKPMSLRSNIQNIISLARYNMKIIFGGKFVYFILAAFIFFLVFGIIMALEASDLVIEDVYGLLAFPAILLVFFPSVFGIQSDADHRTLEIIFGIPNYRYKVWMVRYLMILILVFALLFPFAGLAYYALISFPIVKMILQLMVLVLFVSALGFCISTIVKNGNATAVIMVIVGLALLILSDELDESKWNIFLNPFNTPGDINEIVWREIIRQNRIIMGIGSLVLLLLGLLNLQRREKFLR
jgi:ABC-type transport system involved in multi-copper enzyme maturation permease subunit